MVVANPILITQAAQLAIKHRRKLLALLLLPVVCGWVIVMVMLMGVGALGAVIGTAQAYDADTRGPGNVPLEYIDWIRQGGNECAGVPASVLAAIAATTSRWEPAHEDQGRAGLMWLGVDVVATHVFDAEPDGVVDAKSAPDAIMIAAVWLCDLAGDAKASDPLLVQELLAAYEAGVLALPAPAPGPLTAQILEAWADYLWLDQDLADGPAADGWGAPTENRHITSPYGKRNSPCQGCSSFHQGTDLRAGCGVALWAAAAGTVVYAGPAVGTGNRIDIDHGGGVVTRYGHMYTHGIHVKAGDAVDVGHVIGASGSAGSSTACHLHFEVTINGELVNPEPFMAERGVTFTR